MAIVESISRILHENPNDFESVRSLLRKSKSDHGDVETKDLNKRFHIPGYHFIKREKVLQLIKDGTSIGERTPTPASVQEHEEAWKVRQFKMFPELKVITDPKEFEKRKQKLGAAYLNGLTTAPALPSSGSAEPSPTRAFLEWKRMTQEGAANDTVSDTAEFVDKEPVARLESSPAQSSVASQEAKFTFPFISQPQQTRRDASAALRTEDLRSDEMINRITLEHTINTLGPEAQKLSQRKTELIKRVLRGEIGDEESRIDATLQSLRDTVSEMTSVLTDRIDELESTLQTLVDRIESIESQIEVVASEIKTLHHRDAALMENLETIAAHLNKEAEVAEAEDAENKMREKWSV
jgi:flagellar capping protein FliD